MIDITVPARLITDAGLAQLADRAGRALLAHEGRPAAPPFDVNTGVTVHVVDTARYRTVAGPAEGIVRFQVLTPPSALSRDGLIGLLADLHALVQELAGEGARSWVQVSETVDGGWGVDGFAPTTAELRALLASATT
jgi:hypothetical protein